jgi:hypothetical protein
MKQTFSVQPVPGLHNEGSCSAVLSSHVEAGSNISTVVLRVVGGDEKGTQCLGL